MVAAIRQTVTVGADGRIEIRSPDLRPGAQAEVIVFVESATPQPPLTQLEALQKLQATINLTPEGARQWMDEVRAERRALGNRT